MVKYYNFLPTLYSFFSILHLITNDVRVFAQIWMTKIFFHVLFTLLDGNLNIMSQNVGQDIVILHIASILCPIFSRMIHFSPWTAIFNLLIPFNCRCSSMGYPSQELCCHYGSHATSCQGAFLVLLYVKRRTS